MQNYDSTRQDPATRPASMDPFRPGGSEAVSGAASTKEVMKLAGLTLRELHTALIAASFLPTLQNEVRRCVTMNVTTHSGIAAPLHFNMDAVDSLAPSLKEGETTSEIQAVVSYIQTKLLSNDKVKSTIPGMYLIACEKENPRDLANLLTKYVAKVKSTEKDS